MKKTVILTMKEKLSAVWSNGKTTASESGVCKSTMGDRKNNQAEIEK